MYEVVLVGLGVPVGLGVNDVVLVGLGVPVGLGLGVPVGVNDVVLDLSLIHI